MKPWSGLLSAMLLLSLLVSCAPPALRAGPGQGATPASAAPPPTTSGIAYALAHPGQSVELDLYYSGAGPALPGGGPPRPYDVVICPERWRSALTEQPFQPLLNILNGRQSNDFLPDELWLIAVTAEMAQASSREEPDLPYHARLRGHVGDPAFAHCRDAARMFVVEAVMQVYAQEPPEAPSPLAALHLDRWPTYHDPAGYTLPYPPEWALQTVDGAVELRSPEWPEYPIVVRVHPIPTVRDPLSGAPEPPLLQGIGWSVYEQGWSLGPAGAGGLFGYVVHRQNMPEARDIAVLFSAHERTYELSLRYPLGLRSPQPLLTALTGMVEGFRLDEPQEPTPTPAVRQALGEGPFLSREEALALAGQEGTLLGVSETRLVAEAEARQSASACAGFDGHREGVWLLRVRLLQEGVERRLQILFDAVSGEKLCGEELPPEPTTPAPVRGPTPTPAALQTYRNEASGYALDYPAGWFVQAVPGGATMLTNFDLNATPGRGGLGAGQTKIDIVREPWGAQPLEEMVAHVGRDGTAVLRRERWTLASDLPAERLQVRSEVGGEMALVLTVIEGHSLLLQGYGDLGPFDAIARTLRPLR